MLFSLSTQATPSQTYDNPIPGREFILSLFDSFKQRLNREQIATALDLNSPEEKEALRRRLRAMERDGQLMFQRQSYQLIDPDSLVTGSISIHPDGFGFVSFSDTEKDLFLPKTQLNHVFDGDVVQVLIEPGRGEKRSFNNLIKVVERKTTHIAGLLTRQGKNYFLTADSNKISQEIQVDHQQLLKAKAGQYVNAEITDYPTYRKPTQVKITEVLGFPQETGMETKLALRRHGINELWTDELVSHAKKIGNQVAEKDKAGRVDYRELPFVTIDGSDAKDFDDAVYCEQTEQGSWRLFVAIADVSHYIKPNDALDIEAQQRATSIYFPGQVVPMLPESLSNGLCSLNPDEDRLVMVCEMHISRDGIVTESAFSEGLIRSHARLTYNQAYAVVAQPRSKLTQKVNETTPSVVPHVKNLHALYLTLIEQRKQRGAIEFETKELTFNLNKKRKIDSIKPVKRNDAHRMIEEFMLCANVATAEFLAANKIPSMFRVHPSPQQKKLTALRALLAEKSLKLGGGDSPTSKHYNELLERVNGRADADSIRTLLLRSQSQAEYSEKNQGHFGLAYDAYTHFTSPIRRYPDLLTHRAIRAKLRNNAPKSGLQRMIGLLQLDKLITKPLPKKDYPYDLDDMEMLSKHCSDQSRLADTVSREVESDLMCQYMQPFIGDTFQASVTGVTNFGIFVEIDKIGAEGLVHTSTLPGDTFTFDAPLQRLENGKQSYSLGDRVEVSLKSIDMQDRKMVFLVE
ncbi:ribonuclease R [Reinekea forsetii]|nr:ribonuclease R [Reinekea forsetii]